MATLGKSDPPAYFMSYTVTESNRAAVSGSNGALLSSTQAQSRWLEAQVRVGSYDLDNTRKVAGGGGDGGGYGEPIPVDDDAGVVRRAMWRQTENEYRAAADALIKIQTGRDVQVQTVMGARPGIFHMRSPMCPIRAWRQCLWTGGPGSKRRACTPVSFANHRPF